MNNTELTIFFFVTVIAGSISTALWHGMSIGAFASLFVVMAIITGITCVAVAHLGDKIQESI
ncbi:hypothetical protein [Brucella thiophenivorans]|uniref:hypothetical protein n=1 Tax=Brucella thiophenivorans TaxID=571255 RepID=UPI00117CC4FE|nr:hypothetical protein [Brucella thiophenivorans]